MGPAVILPLYLQVAFEHLQTCLLRSLLWTAFGSELNSPKHRVNRVEKSQPLAVASQVHQVTVRSLDLYYTVDLP